MADGGPSHPSSESRRKRKHPLVCRYFIRGVCEKGDQCQFYHDKSRAMPEDKVCKYYLRGRCTHKGECRYDHVKNREPPTIDQTTMKRSKMLEQECLKEKASSEKVCGICLERVMDKVLEKGRDYHRFGILENCSHCFCLTCIMEWRKNRSEDTKKTHHRLCPSCRTESCFVTPSEFWVEEPEKKKLIDGYRTFLAKKPCRYFEQGKGKCPFSNSCFYLHALPDGSIAPPEPLRKPQRVYQDDELSRENRFWDLMRLRDEFNTESQSYLDELIDDVPDELLESVCDLIIRELVGHEGDNLDPEVVTSLARDIKRMTEAVNSGDFPTHSTLLL